MSTEEPPAAGAVAINALVPELAVIDARASLGFYRDLLGFEVVYERPEEGFAFLSRGDAQLMLYEIGLDRTLAVGDAPLERPLGRGVNLQIQVEAIQDRLNATPRKCLGWRTPAEACATTSWSRPRPPDTLPLLAVAFRVEVICAAPLIRPARTPPRSGARPRGWRAGSSRWRVPQAARAR